MPDWMHALLPELRARLTPADEGSLWLLFFDDSYDEPALAVIIDDAMAHLDNTMTDTIVEAINEVRANALVAAVPRADGFPLACDYKLRTDLERETAGSWTEFVDLVVVGEETAWSVRE